jgi:hypothetical protein
MPHNYFVPGDGQGDANMPSDLGDDCLELVLEDATVGHTAFMEDLAANEEIQGTVIDFASGRKFNEVGPIEAAAAEVIMRIKP